MVWSQFARKISATNPAGSLTFQFKSDAYVTSTGWKALISCKTTEEIIIENGWSGIVLIRCPNRYKY